MTKEQIIQMAVDRLVALRRLTTTRGVITRRAQNTLLKSLPDDILIEVSLRLQRIEMADAERILSGTDGAQ